ncbi:MAG: MBG domain-containing protein, partial [Burkholderiales bacterium]|nr:MBG domain-containing protein [Burkholderiales bacterium]
MSKILSPNAPSRSSSRAKGTGQRRKTPRTASAGWLSKGASSLSCRLRADFLIPRLGVALLVVHGQVAYASELVLPKGGTVAAGAASISTAGPAMTVTQTSDRAIVNWQSFSVGQPNSVNFVQPSSGSAVLNRVTGSTTSTIAGSLTGNGQVFLVNPNGIAITPTGSVKVGGGFVGSTLGIGDDDFMGNRLRFSGTSAGTVANSGSIEAGTNGFVALLSNGGVRNEGTISVPTGKVALGAGSAVTLDPTGTGFMQILAPSTVTEGGPLVDAGGRITADGGRIEIAARSADKAVRDLVKVSGTLSASSVRRDGGAIVLDAGPSGRVRVTGRVEAKSAAGKGGSVRVGGRSVQLAGATVDARGATGGGEVKIGGGVKGAIPAGMTEAQDVLVDGATVIRADATETGNGGLVTLWSSGATDFAGTISARGGATSGDGGFVETSSRHLLTAAGTVDAGAARGKGGEWLLDPTDITIVPGTGTDTTSTVHVGRINDALATGTNVTVATSASGTQPGDITLQAGANVSTTTAASLTLNAHRNIVLNGNVLLGSGLLTLNAAGGSVAGTGTVTGTGAYAANGGRLAVNTGSGSSTLNIALTGGAGTGFTAAQGAFIHKTGAGALTLNGLVTLGGEARIRNEGSGMLTVAASIDVGTNALRLTGGGPTQNIDLAGVVSGTGSDQLNDHGEHLGPMAIVIDAVNWPAVVPTSVRISGNNTFTGSVSAMTSTTVEIAHSNALGLSTSDKSFRLSQAQARLNGGITVGSNVTWTVSNGGIESLAGNNTVSGQILVNGNSYIRSDAGSTLRLNGRLWLAEVDLAFTGAGTTNLQGNILNLHAPTGGQSVTIGATGQAGGTVNFSGNNVYLGPTNILAGTLAITGAGRLGAGSYNGAISIADGARLRYASTSAQTLSGAISGPGSLMKDTAASTLTLSGANTFTGGVTVSSGTVNLSGSLDMGAAQANVTVGAGSTFGGTGALTTTTLQVAGAGTVNLTGNSNRVGTVRANGTIGTLTLNNAQSLVAEAITANGPVTLTAPGPTSDVTLNGVVTSAAGGNAIVLAAGRNFLNNAGATALRTTALGSHWLVYSNNPNTSTFGNLNSNNTAVWNATYATLPPLAVTQAGNRYLFAFQPTLTVDATPRNKTYGDTVTLATGPTTGLSPGVAGAFKADSLADAVEGGTITLISNGTAATAPVGVYAINVQERILNGYAVNAGTLAVDQRWITVAADNKARDYGDTNPTFTYTTARFGGGTGLVNGDTLSGTMESANERANVGNHAINRGTLGDTSVNYQIVSFNPGILTVGQRQITVSAVNKDRAYGDANPTFTYTTARTSPGTGAGLVNGDTLTGTMTTPAGQYSNVGDYAINQGTLAASANYQITAFNPGTLTVGKRQITVSAANKDRAYGDTDPTFTYTTA